MCIRGLNHAPVHNKLDRGVLQNILNIQVKVISIGFQNGLGCQQFILIRPATSISHDRLRKLRFRDDIIFVYCPNSVCFTDIDSLSPKLGFGFDSSAALFTIVQSKLIGKGISI